MAEDVITDRDQVTFVEGTAKYGSNELMPPGLYVYTVWRCPSSGYAVELRPGNPGINPTPGVLVLQPWIRPPSGDEPVIPKLTEVAVLYVDHEVRPDAVSIRCPGGATLPVEPL
jgi:hypothetical protein